MRAERRRVMVMQGQNADSAWWPKRPIDHALVIPDRTRTFSEQSSETTSRHHISIPAAIRPVAPNVMSANIPHIWKYHPLTQEHQWLLEPPVCQTATLEHPVPVAGFRRSTKVPMNEHREPDRPKCALLPSYMTFQCLVVRRGENGHVVFRWQCCNPAGTSEVGAKGSAYPSRR